MIFVSFVRRKGEGEKDDTGRGREGVGRRRGRGKGRWRRRGEKLIKEKTRPIAISCVLRANSDGPTDRRTDGPTDRVAYRIACTRQKNMEEGDNARERLKD